MSETKHTPGQWLKVFPEFFDDQGVQPAFIVTEINDKHPEDGTPEAVYIPLKVAAAAPELLASLVELRLMLNYVRHSFTVPLEDIPEYQRSTAALTKASGEGK